jgi:CDP-glucose 4,6-dehydratase
MGGKTMNILITGAGGFIGQRLAEYLGNDHAVYGLIHDKQPWPNKWTPLRGDITDYSRMLEIMVDREIQQVYHLAAKAIVRNCKSDPIGCFRANVMGTVNVLEAARHSDNVTGIMCAESDKTYGAGPVPYREDQALVPGSVYEASKACVSHVAAAYCRNYGLPVFTVRSANVYGPNDDNMTRLIPNTITRLLRGERPQITAGADRFIREFFYIDDFVSVATALMEAKPWGETFNVGSGETQSVGEIVALLCELTGSEVDSEEWAKPACLSEIPEQVLCLDKLNSLIPDRHPLPLRAGLARTIEWYTNQSR